MHHRYFLLILTVFLGFSAGAFGADAGTWEPGAEQSAKKLYEKKCSKCHRLYDPKEYDDVSWSEWIGKMKEKAHLNDEQYDSIVRYIEGLRKG